MKKGEYFLLRKANGDARTAAAIGAEYDVNKAQADAFDAPSPLTPAETAAHAKAVADHDAVNTWLTAQRNGTPAQKAQFETMRVKPFADQKIAAGVV